MGWGSCWYKRDHVNNASEAYLMCLQVCLQICIREEVRLMTPFCYKRKIPTLSIVFQLISQTTRMNYLYGCSCRSTRQISRMIYPNTRMYLEDCRQNYPQRYWSSEQVVRAQNLLLWWNTPQWEHGTSALPSLWGSAIWVITTGDWKKAEHAPVPWSSGTHFTMRWSSMYVHLL